MYRPFERKCVCALVVWGAAGEDTRIYVDGKDEAPLNASLVSSPQVSASLMPRFGR